MKKKYLCSENVIEKPDIFAIKHIKMHNALYPKNKYILFSIPIETIAQNETLLIFFSVLNLRPFYIRNLREGTYK